MSVQYISEMNSRAPAIILLSLIVALAFSGCATAPEASVRGGGGPSMTNARNEAYNGPKARLAVIKFINKSAKGGSQLGGGMADMLVTALFNSNRFIMLDRQDLDAVINEQDFAAAGKVSQATAIAIGELEGAELLVMGAVTGFEADRIGAGGIAVGILSLGASIAVKSANRDAPLGAVTYKESFVSIDLKIVDAKTGRVVFADSVEGKYKNWGGGIIGGVGGGWSRTPVGLGGWAGTGAEQAIRVCIESAVADVVKNIPAQYYRFEENSDTVMSSQLAAIYPVNLANPVAFGPAQREARIIEGEDDYRKLLSGLHVDKSTAPAFDWSRNKLVAVFAGEKPAQGYRIGVDKAIHHKDRLEIQIKQAAPPEPDSAEPGPDWPFDVVRIENPGKPIEFVWN